MDKMMEFMKLTREDWRYGKWVNEYEQRGFADFETWSLDTVLAKIIHDRLERYLEVAVDHIVIEPDMKSDIEFCIKAFGKYSERYNDLDIDEEKALKEAREAFKKLSNVFPKLWW